MLMSRLAFFTLFAFLSACQCVDKHVALAPPSSNFQAGPVGKAGEQSPVFRDTQGNILGYYEYLPTDFELGKDSLGILFYWNGSNAISGNGRDELTNLLTQGLPQFIHQGRHFPAIIISASVPNWRGNDVRPFVNYILKKYSGSYDTGKVYMSGFSAGGGITVRYAARYPETLTAIVPIAPAAAKPKFYQPSRKMADIPSWFFHNQGDTKVRVWRSELWHEGLKAIGGDHRLTINPGESHYAWQSTFNNPGMWRWLLAQDKSVTGDS